MWSTGSENWPRSTRWSTTSSSGIRRASPRPLAPPAPGQVGIPVLPAPRTADPAHPRPTPSTSNRRRPLLPRAGGAARSRSPPTWPAVAPTSCSAATSTSSPTSGCAPGAWIGRSCPRKGTLAAWRAGTPQGQGRICCGSRRSQGTGRALCAGHRAPRVPPHRQPAARPVGPAASPGGDEVLSFAG